MSSDKSSKTLPENFDLLIVEMQEARCFGPLGVISDDLDMAPGVGLEPTTR